MLRSFVSDLGIHISAFEHSRRDSLDLQHSSRSVLHRDLARRVRARRRLVCGVDGASCARAAWNNLSFRRMVEDAANAGEYMKRLINGIRNLRLWALFLKELRHFKRDRQLMVALIIPPTIQLVIFGFALNPDVTGLRLGVVDESKAVISRELTSAFTESGAFQIKGYYASSDELGRALSHGDLDAGLVIPSKFDEQQARGTTAKVQIVFDAVNSNTAGIAAGYAQRIIAAFNKHL